MRRAQVVPVAMLLAFAAMAYKLHTAPEKKAVEAAAGESAPPAESATWKPRARFGHRLEPADGTALLGAGQSDEESFTAFAKAVAPAEPTLMMRYVDLRDDLPKFFAGLRADLARHPKRLTPQIGLSLNAGDAAKHYEAETAAGADDARLAQLCEGLRSLGRPAFLRVGYEFNAKWNGYAARPYVMAFQRIAGRVHACANTAMVWDWSPDAELDQQTAGAPAEYARARWEEFYPGDDAVDWWALNLFTPRSITAPATREFVNAADSKKFPVMIAESTLRDADVHEGPAAERVWFAPFFSLVRSQRAIEAICYIDWDWRRYPQWATWGDARVESNPQVAAYVKTQLRAIPITRP